MASKLLRASTARFPKKKGGVPQPFTIERGGSTGNLVDPGTPRAGRRRGRPVKKALGAEDKDKAVKIFEGVLDQQRDDGVDVGIELEEGGGEGITLFGLVQMLRQLGHDRTSQQVQGLCALEGLRPVDTSLEAVSEMRVPQRIAIEVTARCSSDPPLDEFEMMSALAVLAPGNKAATLAMLDHSRIRTLMTSYALPLKQDEMEELAAEMHLKEGGQSPVSSLVEAIHRAAAAATGEGSFGSKARRATMTGGRGRLDGGSGSPGTGAGAGGSTGGGVGGSRGSPQAGSKASESPLAGSGGSPLARRGTHLGVTPIRKSGARG